MLSGDVETNPGPKKDGNKEFTSDTIVEIVQRPEQGETTVLNELRSIK